jgi:hypothetical protein
MCAVRSGTRHQGCRLRILRHCRTARQPRPRVGGSRVLAWRRVKVVPFKGRVERWATQEVRLWEGLYREPTPAGSVRRIKIGVIEGRLLEADELHQTKHVKYQLSLAPAATFIVNLPSLSVEAGHRGCAKDASALFRLPGRSSNKGRFRRQRRSCHVARDESVLAWKQRHAGHLPNRTATTAPIGCCPFTFLGETSAEGALQQGTSLSFQTQPGFRLAWIPRPAELAGRAPRKRRLGLGGSGRELPWSAKMKCNNAFGAFLVSRSFG